MTICGARRSRFTRFWSKDSMVFRVARFIEWISGCNHPIISQLAIQDHQIERLYCRPFSTQISTSSSSQRVRGASGCPGQPDSGKPHYTFPWDSSSSSSFFSSSFSSISSASSPYTTNPPVNSQSTGEPFKPFKSRDRVVIFDAVGYYQDRVPKWVGEPD